MGGTITAGNRQDRRGAVFTMAFPVPAGQKSAQEMAA
jgi:two-component system sensor histidine kinase KdpD